MFDAAERPTTPDEDLPPYRSGRIPGACGNPLCRDPACRRARKAAEEHIARLFDPDRIPAPSHGGSE